MGNKLTTVGGYDGSFLRTNKLLTLQLGKWVKEYPPMNNACSSPAVISTSDGENLIVIGGKAGAGGGHWIAEAELLQLKSKRWYKLTDLPQPLSLPSATIGGDHLNVIGTDANGYSCSLQALPTNDQPVTLPFTLSWKPLPPLPVRDSTAANLCGELLLFGGWRDGPPVNSIYQLVEGQWVEIGSMTTNRDRCLVVRPSHDKIIIVGMYNSPFDAVDNVEECIVI